MQHEKSSDEHAERKSEHLQLSSQAQLLADQRDQRFFYEPLFGIHEETIPEISFLNKYLKAPLWISSMTGGTSEAGPINRLLALACREFGLGMGLGSCRQLLEDSRYFQDFNLRPILGDDRPFFANIGIAQLEKMAERDEKFKAIHEMVDQLMADGLIIHINPLQEFYQKSGDRLKCPPLLTLQKFLEKVRYPVIVKEVGQGMGPKSLEALLELPLAAIELAAFGGTNFSRLEQLRSKGIAQDESLQFAGHNAAEMVDWLAAIPIKQLMSKKMIIVSGGIRNAMDAFYLSKKLEDKGYKAIHGMGQPLLKAASLGQEDLFSFIESHLCAYQTASAFFQVRH